MGCVPERLHLFPREEGCRGRQGEDAFVTPMAVVVAAAFVILAGTGGGRCVGSPRFVPADDPFVLLHTPQGQRTFSAEAEVPQGGTRTMASLQLIVEILQGKIGIHHKEDNNIY